MEQKGVIELFSYWNRLRSGRAAPDRREIEPSDISSYLADTFILENSMRHEATFRLAGTRVCAIFGRELKNFAFYSLFSTEDLSIIKRLTQSCFIDKSVSSICFQGTSRTQRTLEFECIFLPISSDGLGERLFGAMFAKESPYWLGADIILDCKIKSVRVIDPEKELVLLNNRPSVPLPTARPAFGTIQPSINYIHPAVFAGRKMGHLTVISGGLSQDYN